MSFVWILLPVLASIIVGTHYVPTVDQMQASFEEAQKFYASGAYDQAIEEYRRIVESESDLLNINAVSVAIGEIIAPLQEVALYQIGNSYFKIAEELAKRAAHADLEQERSEYKEQAQKNFEEATRYFSLTESESSVQTLKELAKSRVVACLYKIRDYTGVIREASDLVQKYPESPHVVQAMYDIGWAYYDMKDYLHSIEAFQSLIERFPTGYRTDRAFFQIGESYYSLERYTEAIPYYRRLVDRQRIGKMSEMEVLRMKREKIAGLVDETALELAAKALIKIGTCYEKSGEYEKAEEAFELVATQFADERRLAEEAYLREADMQYNRGDFETCIAVYRRAIEAAQDTLGKARMQLLLANRYFETEHYPDAVREYGFYRETYGKIAAQAGLSLEGAGLKIGRAWLRDAEQRAGGEDLDPYRRAETELRRTLTTYPKSSYEIELTFNLGLAVQMQHDSVKTEEALTLFKRVADSPSSGAYRQSALFQIARIKHGQKTYDTAAVVYRQVITELADKPEVDIAFFELGIVERDAGAWKEAIEEFMKVRSGASLFARSRFEAGQILVLHDEHKQAIQILGEGLAAETAPERLALFHYLLGSSYSRLGDYESALPHFDKAMINTPSTLIERVTYGRGVTLFKLVRYADAVQDLDRMWSDPEIVTTAPRLLAATYTALGRVDDALRIYRGLTLSTGTPLERGEYFLALAEIYQRQGRYPDVIKACQDLLNLSFDEPTHPAERPYYLREKAFFLIAEASVRSNDFERAAAEAASGLAAYGNAFYTPDFLFIGGLAALQLDRNAEAATKLTQMIEQYPEHTNAGYAHYYLGYAYFKQTLFAKAIPPFNSVTDHFSNLDVAPDALFRAAECRYNLGQYEEATKDYQKFIDRYPTNSLAEDALYNIVWCWFNLDQSSEATKAINAYLARYPQGRHVATARYTLAEISFNEGEYTVAYDLFRKIEKEFPGSPAAQKAASALPELHEALAYSEYNAVVEIFNRAIQQNSQELFREAIPRFEEVWKRYPETMSGVGAKINVGVCYQRLSEWEQAVAAFDLIIAEGKKGHVQITPDIVVFCERRRDTIARKYL
ncbi:MAG: tetratricopeptide repeat protein [Candidatus Latescibacteria bacterium]|nr:tetratricopeptide repeat protein [Candidatus Latescibacterota bacterium]